MTQHYSLKGKVVLVAGGAKNLGGLISRTFAADGARIVVHYNSKGTKAAADETIAAITEAGGEAFAVQGDLTKAANVTAIGPGPMDTPFFYGQETPERVAFHKSQAMGNQLTRIEFIVPIIKHLVTDGWWITGQTIFANGGYTTR